MNPIKFIPSLTPLRGIAAVLVVFFHYHIFLGPLSEPENLMVSKLYLMVDLFFVLSGFIMLHVYGEWFEGEVSKTGFFKFLRARVARLYPLHLFTFFYLFIWVLYMKSRIVFEEVPIIIQNVFDNSALLGVFTLTHAWGTHMEATWNTASWSISVEWFLYLLFPFIVWIMHRGQNVVKILLAVFAMLGLFYLSYVIEPVWTAEISEQRGFPQDSTSSGPKNTIDVITGFALLRGLCSFIFGLLAYELYKREIGKQVLKHGFLFFVIWAFLFGVWYRDIFPDPIVIPVFLLLILQTAYAEGQVRKVLNSKVFVYLGNISYSIYMVHIPIILTLFILSLIKGESPIGPEEINLLKNWMGAFMLLLFVIIIASLTYRFIEKPARNRLK